MSESIIDVKNITKTYNIYRNPSDRLKEIFHPRRKIYHHPFHALSDVSFQVKKGESLGIIGKNGSGKSTLLKIITGVLTPTLGDVKVNGKVSALLELGTGFNPELSGMENIFFSGALMGLSKTEIEDKLDTILSFADIGHFIHQPVKNYSSGMFVRLAFSLAISIDPDILIVDEALSVGDVFFQQKCHKRIEELVDNGVTLLMVTHGIGAIEKYAKNALLLDGGVLKYLGDSNEAVMRYYQLERLTYIQNNSKDDVVDTKTRISTQDNSSKGPEIFPTSLDPGFDLTNVSKIGDETLLECRYLNLRNEKDEPCRIFQVGDVATFEYEFIVKKSIKAPFVGLELINSLNLLLFATNSLLMEVEVPEDVQPNHKITVRQKVKLDLAPGEYSFNIGFGQIDKKYYVRAKDLSIDSLYSHVETPFRLLKAGNFEIVKKFRGVECVFGGLVGLHSNFDISISKH